MCITNGKHRPLVVYDLNGRQGHLLGHYNYSYSFLNQLHQTILNWQDPEDYYIA